MTTTKIALTLNEGGPDGTYLKSGSCRIFPSARFADTADDLIVGIVPIRAQFSADGPPVVNLLPNDLVGPQNGDTPGWSYTIYYDGYPGNALAPWSFQVLSTGGDSQNLSSLTPAAIPSPYSPYALASELPAIALAPSGDETGATDAAAIMAAYAVLDGSPGRIGLSPSGPWYIECGEVVIPRSGVFIDAPGCVITAEGSGNMIRMYDPASYSSRTARGGGLTGFPVVNITDAQCAFHGGDILQMAVEVQAVNTSETAPAAGVHLDNNYYWAEQMYGRIYVSGCPVRFDNSADMSGSATGSFERAELDIFLSSGGISDGVVFANGALSIDHKIAVLGNMTYAAADTVYAALRLTGSNGNGASHIGIGELYVGVEALSVEGGTAPQTVSFEASPFTTVTGHGFMDFSGNAAFAESDNDGNFLFYGPVLGDASLLAQLATPASHTQISSGFPAGWTGTVNFVPAGDGWVHFSVAMSIASGTVLTGGETICTGIPAGCYYPGDSRVIACDLSGAHCPLQVSSAGHLVYTGATQTLGSEEYLYGQTVYSNSFN